MPKNRITLTIEAEYKEYFTPDKVLDVHKKDKNIVTAVHLLAKLYGIPNLENIRASYKNEQLKE